MRVKNLAYDYRHDWATDWATKVGVLGFQEAWGLVQSGDAAPLY